VSGGESIFIYVNGGMANVDWLGSGNGLGFANGLGFGDGLIVFALFAEYLTGIFSAGPIDIGSIKLGASGEKTPFASSPLLEKRVL